MPTVDAHICSSSCSFHRIHRPEQIAQADQLDGDPMQHGHGTDMTGLHSVNTQAAERIDSAKARLDATARCDQPGVALVAWSAAIDRIGAEDGAA